MVALGVGVGNVCGDWGVLALVMDFREVTLTSPPKFAIFFVWVRGELWHKGLINHYPL